MNVQKSELPKKMERFHLYKSHVSTTNFFYFCIQYPHGTVHINYALYLYEDFKIALRSFHMLDNYNLHNMA